MYAVVGCSNCEALWVVAGRPETTSCPRCGTRHRFETLKQFVTTEDEDHAREVRSAMLAERQGEAAADSATDWFADREGDLDAAGISDEEYLSKSGIDPDAVTEAGDHAAGGRPTRSRRDVILEAVATLDRPSEDEIVEYAVERGVQAEEVREGLEKLHRTGEVARSGDGYRRL